MTIEEIKDFANQIECINQPALIDSRVVIVVDGKNSALSVSRSLISKGFDVCHFFAQKTEQGMEMLRLDKGNQGEGKSDDYSELCRQAEVGCIIKQHRHKQILAVIIPKGDQSDAEERLLVAKKLKEADRTIQIIFEASGRDKDTGVISSIKPSAEEKLARKACLYKGDAGVMLNPNIDVYCPSLRVDRLLNELICGPQRA